MNSMRLRPPRPPENGQAGSGKRQRRSAQRRKFPCSGQKPFARARRPDFSLPLEGKPRKMFAAERLTVHALTCPRCAACTESSPLLPHAVVVSLPTAGVKGASPCSSFFFPFFFLRRKKKRVGTDAVAKSLFEKQNPTSTQLSTNQHHHNHPIGGKNEYRNNRTSQRDQFRL